MGFFMVPDNNIWNYNFIGYRVDHSTVLNYMLGVPKDFYNEAHRPSHFISFNKMEDEDNGVNDDELDVFS